MERKLGLSDDNKTKVVKIVFFRLPLIHNIKSVIGIGERAAIV